MRAGAGRKEGAFDNGIVQHYVTVRGYSFARSLLEKFKTREKKSTQKSMAMRKKVSSKP